MRYLIECTHTYQSSLNTGIQRVVRNIVNESLALDHQHDTILPVVFADGAFHGITGPLTLPEPLPSSALWQALRQFVGPYSRELARATRGLLAALLPWTPWVKFLMAPKTHWGLSRLLLLPREILDGLRGRGAESRGNGLTLGRDDVLVLLDSSWHWNVWPAARAAKDKGVQVVCVVYDLIPNTHPHFCDQHLVGVFNRWMQSALNVCDGFLCISKTVAQQLQIALAQIKSHRTSPPVIDFFWLGSELNLPTPKTHATATQETFPAALEKILQTQSPTYLFVSTIEPRKNHHYTLDAFDALWASGVRVQLVILGRIGWRCEDLTARIRGHNQFNRQLFMLNRASDAALGALYDHCNGLVFTSIVEGFGLPLVEALQRGLPVFASDIPVFREISHEGVSFVDLEDPASLQDAIVQHLAVGAPRLPKPIAWMNWRSATEEFWKRLKRLLNSLPARS